MGWGRPLLTSRPSVCAPAAADMQGCPEVSPMMTRSASKSQRNGPQCVACLLLALLGALTLWWLLPALSWSMLQVLDPLLPHTSLQATGKQWFHRQSQHAHERPEAHSQQQPNKQPAEPQCVGTCCTACCVHSGCCAASTMGAASSPCLTCGPGAAQPAHSNQGPALPLHFTYEPHITMRT